MTIAERLHESYGFDRRVRVLSEQLAALFPENATVLDVGCGDGTIDSLLLELRPDLTIDGIDVLVRPETRIPVREFDGRVIPHPDKAFDCVLFVDVLHHSDDAKQLLREARRTAKQCVVIKDHRRDGFLAEQTLRFMDDVGNKRFGVDLPYNYWSHAEWDAAFTDVGLDVREWKQDLGIYPWPTSILFGRGLHFVSQLGVGSEHGVQPQAQ